MILSSKLLRAHIANRDLVSIRRDGIDDNSMQGVILACSDLLVLVQHVYDFHLDGYMVLRRSDISEISCRSSDRFQKELLVSEGLFDQINFGYGAPIQSFTALLSSRGEQEIVIVEDESGDEPEFLIGSIFGVNADTVSIRHFTGVARVVEPVPQIEIDRITCCQMNTNYIRFYQRHFERSRYPE